MSWGCPYQVYEDNCRRFRQVCQPGRKGCVLEGRVTSLSPSKPHVMSNGGSKDLDARNKTRKT